MSINTKINTDLNSVKIDFVIQIFLNQSPHKTIRILTKVFYICGRNLVILA